MQALITLSSHEDRHTLTFTGLRRDGKLVLLVDGQPCCVSYALFDFLTELLLHSLRSPVDFTPLPSSSSEAVRIRVTVSRLRRLFDDIEPGLGQALIQTGLGAEYRLGEGVKVFLDAGFFHLPDGIVSQHDKEALQASLSSAHVSSRQLEVDVGEGVSDL